MEQTSVTPTGITKYIPNLDWLRVNILVGLITAAVMTYLGAAETSILQLPQYINVAQRRS